MQHVTRLPSSGGGRRGLYSPATDLNIYYLATLRAQEAGDKKMISAPACSRTMGIDFLESLAPVSYGDVPSLSSPPGCGPDHANEGEVVIYALINNLIGRGLIQRSTAASAITSFVCYIGALEGFFFFFKKFSQESFFVTPAF